MFFISHDTKFRVRAIPRLVVQLNSVTGDPDVSYFCPQPSSAYWRFLLLQLQDGCRSSQMSFAGRCAHVQHRWGGVSSCVSVYYRGKSLTDASSWFLPRSHLPGLVHKPMPWLTRSQLWLVQKYQRKRWYGREERYTTGKKSSRGRMK